MQEKAGNEFTEYWECFVSVKKYNHMLAKDWAI